jgi:hypothetical protein
MSASFSNQAQGDSAPKHIGGRWRGTMNSDAFAVGTILIAFTLLFAIVLAFGQLYFTAPHYLQQ